MLPENFFETVAKSPFVIGCAGAAVFGLKFMPGATWIEKGINIFCGAMTAGFLTPALIEYLEIQSPGFSTAAAFFVGLMGMSFIAAVLQGVKDVKMGEVFTNLIDGAIGIWTNRRNKD
jgi:hypothetical protein